MPLGLSEAGTDWAQLEKLVLGWSETSHPPAISEHSRLKLRENDGVVLADRNRSAVVTMVPTREAGHELVEIAASPGVDIAAVWEEARERILALARARGNRSVDVITAMTRLADRLAAEGFRRERAVVRGNLTEPGSEPRMPHHEFRRFRRGTEDEGDLLQLIQLTMAKHPDNVGWESSDLKVRFEETWFDGGGLFLAGEAGALIGYCWTKVHQDGVGEIYLVGVHPAHTGRGLGGDLVARGVEHLLATRNSHRVIVYWDDDHPPAANLYRSAGFRIDRVDEFYRLLL